MAFTEFYSDPTHGSASNLNAGSTTGAPSHTYASGNWVQGTGVFTVASGNPASDGVAVGDWASVYPDGSTAAVFIGRVTARDATTITVSLTAKMGTAPTNGTGDRTLKIGGVWAGPAGAVTFPFSILDGTALNAAGDGTRYNMRNTATYSISANIAFAGTACYIQGYTSTPGDGGRAIIDKSTNAVVALTVSSRSTIADLIVTGSDASGTSAGISITGDSAFYRVRSSGHRGSGFAYSGMVVLAWCEANGNNTANTANIGGFTQTGGNPAFHWYCYSHDNAGSNVSGFVSSNTTDAAVQYVHCISDTNGRAGFLGLTRSSQLLYLQCDAFNNGLDGIRFGATTNGSVTFIVNCNFFRNGTASSGFGIIRTDSLVDYVVHVQNCAFGQGSEANSGGETSGGIHSVEGTVLYPSGALPWAGAPAGNFTLTHALALERGYGYFPPGMTGTGYPPLGAVIPSCGGGDGTGTGTAGGGGGDTVYLLAPGLRGGYSN